MSFETGAAVWVPCEILRGPFPDERCVRLTSPVGSWAGFVDVRLLRDDIPEGPSAIRATIVSMNDLEASARLPGQTSPDTYLTCSTSWFRALAEA